MAEKDKDDLAAAYLKKGMKKAAKLLAEDFKYVDQLYAIMKPFSKGKFQNKRKVYRSLLDHILENFNSDNYKTGIEELMIYLTALLEKRSIEEVYRRFY